MIETYTVGPGGLPLIVKTPTAILAYGFLWGPYLALIGETLGSAVVTCADSSITVGTPVITDTTVQVTLTGGTLGVTYTVNCRIHMGISGQYDDRSILVKVAER